MENTETKPSEFEMDCILKKTNSEIVTKTGKSFFFGSYNSLDRFHSINVEAVFVDGTFDMHTKKEDEIYGVLAPCMKNYPQRFFIFVQ